MSIPTASSLAVDATPSTPKAAAAAAAAGGFADGSIHTGASTPLTPLEQRQWRATTQRLLRTTLTSMRDAHSKFEAASEAGQAALSRLCNHALTACLLPSMPLGALSEMQGLRQAALDKLARLLGQELSQLQTSMAALAACAVTLGQCVEGLASHSCLQPRAPVFICITLPNASSMVQRVHRMYAEEVSNKHAVVSAAAVLVAAYAARHSSQSSGNGGTLHGGVAAMPHKQLQDVCSTWLTCWMLHPFLDEDVVQEVFSAFSEDMAGY